MPLNRGTHISAVIEEVKWLKPQSILDVGCGWGLFGPIFRGYTDGWANRLNESQWQFKIDAIEIFEPYRNKCWEFYNNVYVGDALVEIDKLGKYDLIYCGDAIEHIPKEDAFKLIDKMLAHCNAWVMIATPVPTPPQDEVLSNPAERHVSNWSIDDFKNYNHELVGMFGEGGNYIMCVRIKP